MEVTCCVTSGSGIVIPNEKKRLWNAKRVELLSNVDRTGTASLQRQKAQHTACLKAINQLLSWQCTYLSSSGVPRNFVRRGGSTHSVEDGENGDLRAVAP